MALTLLAASVDLELLHLAQEVGAAHVPPKRASVHEVLGALRCPPQGPLSIAARLGISVHAVRGHVKSISWKLDAHNQLEAVSVAVRAGMRPRS